MADFIVEAHRPDLHLTIYPDGWIPIVQDSSRRYCEGYMARISEQSPRPAYRMRRGSDGAIVAQCHASDEPQIGMVAGWSSDEQCIRGAVRAMEAARRSQRDGGPDPRIAAALAVLEAPMFSDLRLVPFGAPCSLAECPPGPFMAVRSGGALGFKTEYGRMCVVPGSDASGRSSDLRWTVGSEPDVYCLESGETWCSDTLVQPLGVFRG